MIIRGDSPRARKAVLLCVALTALTASRASGLVFCKGRKPTVTVRDKCKKREQQVDAATIGGLKGDPGAPGAPGPAFHIVDKDGKEVGSVVGVNGTTATILREINGELFELTVSSRGFGSDAIEITVFLVYTDSACASQAYVEMDLPPPIFLANYLQVSADGRTGYYGLPSEERVPPNLYGIYVVDGTDDTGARNACLGGGGQIVKDAHDCLHPTPPNVKCVWCCKGTSAPAISPVHTIDMSPFGLTPPFTLKRQ